jgi:hypothetical protein
MKFAASMVLAVEKLVGGLRVWNILDRLFHVGVMTVFVCIVFGI